MVINRLNPTQLYTVTFGMMSLQMSKKLENLDNHKEREELFFKFMNDINETQAKALEEYYINLTSEDKDEFWEDIYEDGIYFHQPPFYDNIEFDQLSEVMHKYDIEPFKFKGIENKMVMGDLYFVMLKHTASSKFSARSVGYNNIKNIPAKSKAFKENENLYRKNPLRLGEMEISNLLLTKNPKEIKRFLSLYSSNKESRQKMVDELLNENIFNMEKIETSDTTDITRRIFDSYLKSMGLELTNDEDEQNSVLKD